MPGCVGRPLNRKTTEDHWPLLSSIVKRKVRQRPSGGSHTPVSSRRKTTLQFALESFPNLDELPGGNYHGDILQHVLVRPSISHQHESK